jgi:hypothetical protein
VGTIPQIDTMPTMAEDREWNWTRAWLTIAVVGGAIVALAIPESRRIGALILLGCWFAFVPIWQWSMYSGSKWYGPSKSNVWFQLATAGACFLAGCFAPLAVDVRIFVFCMTAIAVAQARWMDRQLTARQS